MATTVHNDGRLLFLSRRPLCDAHDLSVGMRCDLGLELMWPVAATSLEARTAFTSWSRVSESKKALKGAASLVPGG